MLNSLKIFSVRRFRPVSSSISFSTRPHTVKCAYLTSNKWSIRKDSSNFLVSSSSSFSRSFSTTARDAATIEPPTRRQYRILAVYSAIPMIAFGIMDNTIMIQAGDVIDNTLGVRLGLATLAAAACGQVVSDFSGVVFGGTVEAFFTNRLGLPVPNLTPEQNTLKSVKLVRTASSAIGVVLGCLLGMISLFFIDLKAAERAKRETATDALFQAVMKSGKVLFGAEKSSLWLVDEDAQQLWCKVFDAGDENNVGDSKQSNANHHHEHAHLKKLIAIPINSGIAGSIAQTGGAELIPNAYEDDRFNSSIDLVTGQKTRDILVCAVKNADGKVVGVIQMVNSLNGFNEQDLKSLRVVASNVGLFLSFMNDSE